MKHLENISRAVFGGIGLLLVIVGLFCLLVNVVGITSGRVQFNRSEFIFLTIFIGGFILVGCLFLLIYFGTKNSETKTDEDKSNNSVNSGGHHTE